MSEENENIFSDQDKTNVIPLLPLRDVVVFPHMIVPLFVGREKSIAALESAMKYEKGIFMVAQKNAKKDDPGEEDIIPSAPSASSSSCCVFRMEPSKCWSKGKIAE